jgi:hypothetical protein
MPDQDTTATVLDVLEVEVEHLAGPQPALEHAPRRACRSPAGEIAQIGEEVRHSSPNTTARFANDKPFCS